MSDRLPEYLRARETHRHFHPVVIRFRDLDLLGHVNNVNLAGWLEDARVALELPIQPLVPNYGGPVIVLADLRIQFLDEVRADDEIVVGSCIERLGRTSMWVGQAIFTKAGCAVVARAIEVLIDDRTRKPISWPDHFSSVLGQYLIAPAA